MATMLHLPSRAALLVLLAAPLDGAEAQVTQRANDRDLIAAGFVMRPADTPGKMARLKSIPPHRFTARTKDGVRYYIYADPNDCKCAFVGYQKAFDTYRDMVRAPAPPPGLREFAREPAPGNLEQHLMVQDMDDDAGLLNGDDFHLRFD
jgi:hypothetical protein